MVHIGVCNLKYEVRDLGRRS